MSIFLAIIIFIICILLILVILVQNSKGGGLTSNFSSSNQIMGVRRTTDFLEKATWGLAIALLLMSLVAAATTTGNRGTETVQETSEISDMVNDVTVQNVNQFNQTPLPEGQQQTPATPPEGK